MLLRAAMSLLISATAAGAGPWPEQSGGLFLSVTEDFADGLGAGKTTVFIESSAKDRFSVGVDSVVDETGVEWRAFAFIRQPLTPDSARDRVAISAGLGAQEAGGESEPLVVLGGAWGRSSEAGLPGWFSVEGEARHGTTSGRTVLEGGATVAFQPLDRIALVNEVSVSGLAGTTGETDTFLTSSIVGTISERARVSLGATVDLAGDASPGIRLGTWLEF